MAIGSAVVKKYFSSLSHDLARPYEEKVEKWVEAPGGKSLAWQVLWPYILR